MSARPEIAPGAHVASGARLGEGVTLAPGVVVQDEVELGDGTTVGPNAVIHSNTRLGARCVVEAGALLGKTPRLRRGSSASGGEARPLVLEAEVTVCCGAVVYAGAHIAAGAIIGDQAQIRERATVGERTVVGRGSSVDFDAHVAARVLIQSSVYVTAGTLIEDDVFLGPGVVTTNDHTMGRHPEDEPLRGPVFRKACRVGGGAVVAPGVEIGAEAFVAAGAVVVSDVGAREVAMGVPARVVRTVPEGDLSERWPA